MPDLQELTQKASSSDLHAALCMIAHLLDKRVAMQGRKKIKLVQLFTEMGLTVIISDVDTVWMRNPFVYFKQYPDADILTSSDCLLNSHDNEGLEDPHKALAAFNIGIMMFSPRSKEFAKQWVERIEADEKVWDQNAFNECGPGRQSRLVAAGIASMQQLRSQSEAMQDWHGHAH